MNPIESLQNWAIYGVNGGIHIPAPWFAYGYVWGKQFSIYRFNGKFSLNKSNNVSKLAGKTYMMKRF
jgi:hypothetical protein